MLAFWSTSYQFRIPEKGICDTQHTDIIMAVYIHRYREEEEDSEDFEEDIDVKA